jgi:hypothetical protein
VHIFLKSSMCTAKHILRWIINRVTISFERKPATFFEEREGWDGRGVGWTHLQAENWSHLFLQAQKKARSSGKNQSPSWYDTGHIQNDASNNSSIVASVFVTAVTFLPSRCLATTRGFLPSRSLATIWGFLPSRCLETIGGIYRRTHKYGQQRDLVSLLCFFFFWK